VLMSEGQNRPCRKSFTKTASGAENGEAFLVIPGALDVGKNELPGLDSPSGPGLRPPIQPPNVLVLETRSSIRTKFVANHGH
jgi:hypothetical protein